MSFEGIELIPVVEADIGKDSKNNWRKDLQVVRNSDGQVIAQDASEMRAQQSTGQKKRGRPRKGMERLLPPEPKKELALKEEKPKEPIKGYSSL